jgi:triacylglycerol lipase
MKKMIAKFSLLFTALAFSISFTVSCDETSGGGSVDDGPAEPGPTMSSPFDINTAVELMFLSLEAYQMLADSNDGVEFTLPEPYDLIVQFLTGESFLGTSLEVEVPIAFIATKGNNIFVVFRGTKTIDEWISDADFPLVPYPPVSNGALTEKGFTDIYGSLGVVDEINQLAGMGNFENVFVTGHSLGAALAVLAIPDIIEHTDFKNPIMYSFAGPRAGNSDFMSLYDGFGITSWRVVNTNDEVPKLPPEDLSYVHVDTGEPITFGKPITDPFDFDQIEFNHSSCNYYSTLCDMTDDPKSCKDMGDGLDDCMFDSM